MAKAPQKKKSAASERKKDHTVWLWLGLIAVAAACAFAHWSQPAAAPKSAAAAKSASSAAAVPAANAQDAVVRKGECGLAHIIENAGEVLGGDAFFEHIDELIKRARIKEGPQSRMFDADGEQQNHQVQFLQYEADSALVSNLWEMTRRADGWGVTAQEAAAPRLALRCLEAIDYFAAKGHGLEYHDDGDTFLTAALMLSHPSEFAGGDFELRRGNCIERHAATRGELMVWRGWDDHRVHALTRGRRRVLVVEWRCCSAANDTARPYARADDSYEGFLAAIARDAAAPNQHKHLGVLLRDERKDLAGALASFQAALQHDKHTHYHRSLWQRIGETRAALEDMAGTIEAIQMLARLGAMDAAQQIGGLLAQLRQKNPEAAAQLLRAQRGG